MEFYILEISVEPGGARKNDVHLLFSLVQVHKVLREDLINDAHLAIWYSENLLLHRCKKEDEIAKIIDTIDLHERITFYIGNFEPIRFDKENNIIGYIRSEIFDDSHKSIDDPSPIDFTSKDIEEVYRYLNYDVHEIFRIMKSKGINGSNIERYPPNVGVQIDLSGIPRIETERQSKIHDIKVKFGEEIIKLSFGLNDFS